MSFILKLPKLNLPNITLTSTFYKLIEEIAEAKRSLNKLEDFENQNTVNIVLLNDEELNDVREKFKFLVTEYLKEIIDISQTCVSLLFAFQESKQVSEEMIKDTFDDYLKEIQSATNIKVEDFYIYEKNGFKYMHLPFIKRKMNMQKTLDSIVIASGKFAQLIGKYSKISGETNLNKSFSEEQIIKSSLICIIKIAQLSSDLLRNMNEQYNLNLEKIIDEHIAKLKERKYL